MITDNLPILIYEKPSEVVAAVPGGLSGLLGKTAHIRVNENAPIPAARDRGGYLGNCIRPSALSVSNITPYA